MNNLFDIYDRGFLGIQDPLERIDSPIAEILENISLSKLIEGRTIRQKLIPELQKVNLDEKFFSALDQINCERLMHLYSYFASAYIYARHETPINLLPKEIAVPLVKFAEKLGRKPILSYASYCLTNWRRKVKSDPICLENIELLTNFCAEESGKRDEDWFILVHVEIESLAGNGVFACKRFCEERCHQLPLPHLLFRSEDVLTRIRDSLNGMNKTLSRMPEQCSPDNYFRWVRPYIFSFKDVVYEDCFDNKPQTFRGETGAQSTIIPVFLAALGIQHKDSILTKHLVEMRDYMPKIHRELLEKLLIQPPILREVAKKGLKDLYNECVKGIIQFREKHFEFAVNYIQNKVNSPEGTGGTPYVHWLKQLKEETEGYLL